jgi:UDP-glucose 4-epimerase
MKALVTGSRGFVGRHVRAGLERRGYDTIGIDIIDGNDALDVFRKSTARYSLVVHAAASSPHRAAIDGEPQHLARNLQLDAAMFDWAVRTEQGRVVYLSSSAAYPIGLQERDHGWRLEERDIQLHDLDAPDAVYGWAKLTGEMLARQARAAGLPVTVVRPFSGYGEDQTENFPFRAIVERARRREDPFMIWGDGTQVRDWIHIDDVAAGMLAVAESGTDQPVNLCTGYGTSMIELARIACRTAGYSPAFDFRTDKPAGVAYRVGDPGRFHHYWVPKVSLEDGVTRALSS